ncbi:MAG: iron-containing alcohol dehydrogenase [Deltaproteobacteria bacterium]|jgi:alcohol dehydrogenase YqhD (iron-dependent ADH family)|nr:iron-containing alcohol dehydrogenase [Deltaproteobacteria bacterium]
MHTFTYHSPTKIIFGQDTAPNLIPELHNAKISRVLVLTGGKSVYASGLHGAVADLLNQAGIRHETVSGVLPNPRLSKVREGVAAAKAIQAQAILPIGGGSVFDSAKAVAVGAASEYDIWDFMTRKHTIAAALPVYGILTLSGTSSEVNNTAVISNEATQEKFALAHELLIPRAAVVDPALQYSVPLNQVCYSGVDALSHVLEAYFESLDTSEVILEHCEAYAKTIIRCLRGLPGARENYDVRSELAFCSIYAHSGWASVGRARRGDFTSHRIGHALGGIFDVPHGVTLGILMPNWMRYVYDRGLCRDTFTRFATHIMGIKEAPDNDFALAGAQAFKDFVRSLGMPVSMREVGVKETDIPALAENASRSLPFGCVIPMDPEHIAGVLRQAL